jgi:hypothetical protein
MRPYEKGRNRNSLIRTMLPFPAISVPAFTPNRSGVIPYNLYLPLYPSIWLPLGLSPVMNRAGEHALSGVADGLGAGQRRMTDKARAAADDADRRHGQQ